MIEQMDCGRAGLVQDDIRARMKEGEPLVDVMAPMTSTMASMVDSLVVPMEVSMVAPMVLMVASMVAPMASMVEALVWLKRMTAESKYDDERVDGWTHKFREKQVHGLTMKIDGERADVLTHKVREELTIGLIFLDCVVQVVTWARTKITESLVDSMALMTLIASTVAMMVASMMTMVAPMASSRSKEEKIARGDKRGYQEKMPEWETMPRFNSGFEGGNDGGPVGFDGGFKAPMASMVPSRASVVASMASMVVSLEWLNLMAAEPKRGDERVDGLTFKTDEVGADGWTAKTCENELMGGPAEIRSNRWLWTVLAPHVVDAMWLKSLPPLNYESVQMESVRS